MFVYLADSWFVYNFKVQFVVVVFQKVDLTGAFLNTLKYIITVENTMLFDNTGQRVPVYSAC